MKIGYPDTKNKKRSSSSSPFFVRRDQEKDQGIIDNATEHRSNPDVNTAAATGQDEKGGFKKEDGTSKNVNRKTKGGGYNAQGVWVKTGGKATGKIKDYAHGSKERYDEYEARGWAHDETTKGYKPPKDKDVKSVKVQKTESEKKLVKAKKDVDTNKQKVKEARKSDVVKDAIQTGQNTRKAARKTKRAAKLADKAAKIKKRRQERADAIIERGGTKVGAGIRKVGNKIKGVFKRKDKKKKK